MQTTKKAILATTILGLSLTFSSTVSASTDKLFSDVDQTTKYSQAIEYLKNNGIVGGYPDGTFQPERTLNRAELLKILIEGTEEESVILSLSKDDTFQNCFPDVKDEWFAPYVCYAKEQGIVSGYPDGTFQPANEVNFVEGLKMMLGVLEIEYTEGEVWYQDIVEKAAAKRFIPFDITEFSQKLQRGQMSEMMTRGIKDKNGNGELDWYLQNAGDCTVSYASISKNQNIEEECFTSITLNALGNWEWTELVGKNTTELNLSYRSLESVDGLENLKNLTRLDLGANELQNISFLEDLTNLTELDLRDNWLWDISPVANLVNLEKLNLNLNIMGDPAPLGSLVKLKWLGLYKNQYLYDISVLDSLEDLEYIDLGLAELNEGELERFVAQHSEAEIETDLKPWVGMKDFDLDVSGAKLWFEIDGSNLNFISEVDALFEEFSDLVREEMSNYDYSPDDHKQVEDAVLIHLEPNERLPYARKFLWDSHINPMYLEQKMVEHEKVKEAEYTSPFLEKYSDQITISVRNKIAINFQKELSFKEISFEIVQDRKRKGEIISEKELNDDFNGFTKADDSWDEENEYYSRWGGIDTVKYLVRYPEIKSVYFEVDAYFKDAQSCDQRITQAFEDREELKPEEWNSCRFVEFNLNGTPVYFVDIEYGEEQDCPSGCFYSGYCGIVEGSDDFPYLTEAPYELTGKEHSLVQTEDFQNFMDTVKNAEFGTCFRYK